MRLPNDFYRNYVSADQAARFLERQAALIRLAGKKCDSHRFKINVRVGFACHGWKKGLLPCRLEEK